MEHLEHLQKDRRLRKILLLQEPVQLKRRRQVWLHLCGSIISQQLSTRVAAVIQERFLALYPGGRPCIADVLETPFERLRGVGLSHAKAQYVQEVCRFFAEENITDARLYNMADEELIGYLTQIRGVGRWTVEMLLMFTLAREDVFAVDDLGIQQSMARLYGWDVADKKMLKASMLRQAERWRPYRTYACRYLWGWKDNVPVS